MLLKKICVFCGSSPGNNEAYTRAAVEMGQEIANRGMTLVYGGAGVGLMGSVARATLETGGRVIGVIPESLKDQKIVLEGPLELTVVGSMHERKAKMAEISDGFIALPGGFGTLEEIFEAVTWSQLGIHQKPCGLLNIKGYYDQLLDFLDQVVAEGFLYGLHRDILLSETSSSALLEKMAVYKPVTHSKAHWARQMSNNTTPENH